MFKPEDLAVRALRIERGGRTEKRFGLPWVRAEPEMPTSRRTPIHRDVEGEVRRGRELRLRMLADRSSTRRGIELRHTIAKYVFGVAATVVWAPLIGLATHYGAPGALSNLVLALTPWPAAWITQAFLTIVSPPVMLGAVLVIAAIGAYAWYRMHATESRLDALDREQEEDNDLLADSVAVV